MNGLIGRRLGRYEVVSLLGAGGMGEVYRARDTVLERDVALKVLPEAAAEDPDRLERFAREARAVARLSHPNILEIHDVGHDNDVHYAVTELLEGESLRERLGRGRLPVRKAVSTADAIARGLGAAHAQGVVHRDVKPENVLLTSDGRVKVLDFGIASLHEPEVQAAGPDASEVSTITAAGSLLGTIGYMAPEQVRGEAADARSDVFALGCVLYEMLTGERTFHRATPAESLAAVLHDEPPPPLSLVPDIPAGIDRVVMRCLEKEPGERFQSAADVAFALRAAEGSQGHRTVARRRKLDRRLVVAAIVGAVTVALWGVFSSRRAELRGEWKPRQITNAPGWEAEPALSPDGRQIAYVSNETGNPDIWVVDVAGGTPLRLTNHPAADCSPAWFPDNSSLAFVSDRSGKRSIWKVPRLGGEARMVLEDARDPAISPDGRNIAIARPGPSGVDRVAIATLNPVTNPALLTGESAGLWDHRHPSWSPDGKRICFADFRDLWTVAIDGGTPVPLTADH